MKKLILSVITSLVILNSSSTNVQTSFLEPTISNQSKNIEIYPISHASFAMKHADHVYLFDPVGEYESYKDLGKQFTVFITDIHGDHLSNEVLESLFENIELLICPQAVYNKLNEKIKTKAKIMKNGDVFKHNGLNVEAIPMYNLREEALKFHEKGRGNGYVLTLNGKRIYVSGDTEDIPEMRQLKNIDMAFVCMNLPYTMTVESAADAVLDFKPKQVYPYR